jgi:hypothetical protein
MKKTILSKILLASLFVLSVSFVQAGISKGPCAPKDVCCESYPNDTNAFLYPQDLGLACPRRFYFHADYLLMQPQEEGLDYAIKNQRTSLGTPIMGGDVIGFSDDHSNSWGWDSGFKIGLGGFSDQDSWLIDAEWMWLHIHQKSSINMPHGTDNGYLIPLWLIGELYPSVSYSKNNSADWQAVFNTADARIANPLHLTRFLVATPHIGLRFAYIEQDYVVRYSTNYHGNIASINVFNDNDYWGAGLRGGLDTTWNFGPNFNIFGKVAAALLYGKFSVKQKNDLASPTYSSDVDHEFYQVEPNMDLALGVSWGKYINDRKGYFSIKLAYELHYFWNQNNMRNFNYQGNSSNRWSYSQAVPRGNLSISGLDLAFQFDF